MITEQQVLHALSQVQEPELHRDLVTLKMIKDLQVQGDEVTFTIVLTTPACPLRNQIEAEARAAVTRIGAQRVTIKFDANVPSDNVVLARLEDKNWFGRLYSIVPPEARVPDPEGERVILEYMKRKLLLKRYPRGVGVPDADPL